MRDSEKKVVDPVKSAAIARKKYQKVCIPQLSLSLRLVLCG